MKRYMVVYVDDEGWTGAAFFDTASDADGFRMNVDVSIGGYAEVYERVKVAETVNLSGGESFTSYSEEYRLMWA